MVNLSRAPTSRLSDSIIHLPYLFKYFVWPVPPGQKLTLCCGDKYQHFISGLEVSLLGPSVVDPCLGNLGLLHVFPHQGPQGGHPVPHVSHVFHHGSMGRRLLFPGFLRYVQQPPGSSPIEEFKWRVAGRRLGHFSDREHEIGKQLVPIPSVRLHHLLQHLLQGTVEPFH